MKDVDQHLDSIEEQVEALARQIDTLIIEVQALKPTILNANQGKRCHSLEIELLNLRDMSQGSRMP